MSHRTRAQQTAVSYTHLDVYKRQLQGDAYEGYERTIDVHIRNLRAKIEPDPKHPRYVVTVYGIGYRLEEWGDAA